jgi:3-dehydroquinate dehydratase-2
MKVLVIHGCGMNMRGKVQTDVFGPMTLPQYDERIRSYAGELGIDVEIFHSNIEGEVINKFYDAHEGGVDGAIINPAGYTTGHPALVAAIAQVSFPTIELHVSNPARRGSAVPERLLRQIVAHEAVAPLCSVRTSCPGRSPCNGSGARRASEQRAAGRRFVVRRVPDV